MCLAGVCGCVDCAEKEKEYCATWWRCSEDQFEIDSEYRGDVVKITHKKQSSFLFNLISLDCFYLQISVFHTSICATLR